MYSVSILAMVYIIMLIHNEYERGLFHFTLIVNRSNTLFMGRMKLSEWRIHL